MNTDYAKAFRVIRAAFGLQQGDLAERIGISASQLSLIEKGKRQPSLRVIGNLASTVGIPTSLVTLLASSPHEIANQDVSELASALLRLLVTASGDQRPLPLGS
jgi:transcriptional regulator with XRE-family HTH domain